MATSATTTWLTASLYYNGSWDYFLAKAIKPYVDVVLQTGVAACFFFERKQEAVPHLRLFFKGNSYVLEQILQPNLQEHFQHYFEASTSSTARIAEPAALPFNNEVKFGALDPRQAFFSGTEELSCCEKQFQASSMIVLGKMKDKMDRWNYNERLSTAIKLHLGFAYSVGMSIEEAARFFQFLELDWMTRHLEPEAKKPGQETLRHFRQMFNAQQGDIVSYHSALWELFKNYRKMGDDALIDWFHINASTAMELALALEQGSLETQPGLFPEEQFNTREQARLWNIFALMIQHTNNRLGIYHQQEGYLYFALSNSLRAVISTFHKPVKARDR